MMKLPIRPLVPEPSLGFDFDRYHRVRFRAGIRCPRCGATHVQSWGRFGRRRRFRCVGGCGRTFSTFTGTPLAYLKRVDLWIAHLECVRARTSTRATGLRLGCHRDTAFRWRHRLLASWVAADRMRVGGCVALGQIWMAPNRKGERGLGRPGRRRGAARELALMMIPRVYVLLATEVPERGNRQARRDGRVLAVHIGQRRANVPDYVRELLPRLCPPATLLAAAGPYSAEARVARAVNVPYRRVLRTAGVWPREVWSLRRGLKGWLRPFRGVATRYLQRYLEWFAVGDRLIDDPLVTPGT